MAVIDPNTQIREMFRSDFPHRILVLSVNRVSTGDTLDLGFAFSKLQTAIASSVTSGSNGLPTIAGTVITFAQAGLSNDSIVLLLVGGWA